MKPLPTTMHARRRGSRPGHARQTGAVLIVSLVVLVALTLLGLSAMNTTQLETTLATSSQESTRAFQAAETSLSIAITDVDMWKTTGDPKKEEISIAGGYDTADYRSNFAGFKAVPDGQLWSAKCGAGVQGAFFDFEATGTTSAANSATVHGGAYQIAPGGSGC